MTGLSNSSGHQDSNLGPPAPKAGTLPDCATPRVLFKSGRKGTGVFYFRKYFWKFFKKK